jgi:hypothetical protein
LFVCNVGSEACAALLLTVLEAGGTVCAEDDEACVQAAGRVVIGKMPDIIGPEALNPGERTLLPQLANLGNDADNWTQNLQVLLNEMRSGAPIRDATVDPATGALVNNTGWLAGERDVLLHAGGRTTPQPTSGTLETESAMTEKDELAEIEKWFESLGFGIVYSKDDSGITWADLTRPPGGSVGAPKYGRGTKRIEAARSAKHRYEVEE